MLLCHWSKDVLKLHSSINKPVLLHEGYEGKAVVPDIMHPQYGIKNFLGYQHIVCIKKMTLWDIIAIYVIYLSNCKTNCTYYICTCSSQC